MDNSVCKIFIESNQGTKYGTGFLCYIPFPDKNRKSPFLSTVNHLLREEEIYEGSKINFSFEDRDYINKIK